MTDLVLYLSDPTLEYIIRGRFFEPKFADTKGGVI